MNANLIHSKTFTYKDLLLKKLYYSVICSVVSQLVLIQVYVFVLNFNLVHPIDWISSTIGTFTSVSTWLYVIPFITVIFAQSIICAKDYVFKSNYCSTRFQNFISVFSVHNLILLILNIIVGSTLIWLFLSLGGGPNMNLINICRNQSYCLNEETFFLIVSGFWTGFYYFAKVYISKKHLSFPVIHQRKFLQLKAQIIALLKESFILSITPMFYFIIIYYFWGHKLSSTFCNFFQLYKEESSGNRLIIYLYLWTFGALYCFNMNLMRFFFNLFLTEPVEFPLFKETGNSLSLQQSITMCDLPIIQNLACLDLYNLAQFSKERRQVFFTLSQPGGHPHNWNSLVENILKIFTEYIEILNKSFENPEGVVIPQTTVQFQSPLQSPNRYPNLRSMSLVSDNGMTDVVDVTHAPLPGFFIPDTLLEKVKQKITSVINISKIIFGINFLFGELPQANIQKCLGNGNVIILSSQGISDLVCASINEDQFGIVQKDLPGIITTLVQLKQSLDRLNKVPALSRKIAGYDDFNFKMKGAITMAVKRSLFNICSSFGKFLNEFPLSKDVLINLQTIYKT